MPPRQLFFQVVVTLGPVAALGGRVGKRFQGQSPQVSHSNQYSESRLMFDMYGTIRIPE